MNFQYEQQFEATLKSEDTTTSALRTYELCDSRYSNDNVQYLTDVYGLLLSNDREAAIKLQEARRLFFAI